MLHLILEVILIGITEDLTLESTIWKQNGQPNIQNRNRLKENSKKVAIVLWGGVSVGLGLAFDEFVETTSEGDYFKHFLLTSIFHLHLILLVIFADRVARFVDRLGTMNIERKDVVFYAALVYVAYIWVFLGIVIN